MIKPFSEAQSGSAPDKEADVNRRDLLTAIGALGAATLASCGPDEGGSAPLHPMGEIRQALTQYSVGSIAALRGLSPAAHDAVQVLGYWAPGDDGGGIFFWDSASTKDDNGGTVIRPSTNPPSGRWVRMCNGVISVRFFGAKANGSDDHTAIQNAFDAAEEGGTVVFPLGIYQIDSQITATKGMKILGLGAPATRCNDPFGDPSWNAGSVYKGPTIKYSMQSGSAFSLPCVNGNVTLSGIVFSGPGAGTAAAVTLQDGVGCNLSELLFCNCFLGLALNGVEDSSFRSLRFRGCATGLSLGLNTNSNSFVATDCSVCGIGVNFEHCTSNIFTSGTIQGCSYGLYGAIEDSVIDNFYFENATANAAIRNTSGHRTHIRLCHQGTEHDVFEIGGAGSIIELTRYCRAVHLLPGSFRNIVRAHAAMPPGSSDLGYGNFFEEVSDIGIAFHGSPPATQKVLPAISVDGSGFAALRTGTAGGIVWAIESRDDIGCTRLQDEANNVEYMRMKTIGGVPAIGFFGSQALAFKQTITGVNNKALDSIISIMTSLGLTSNSAKPSSRSAAPSTGNWELGDIVYNSAPIPGGVIGWVCTTAGTPGTWKSFGQISL